MAPEDRRAALIAATIPLLREHGLDVSTRQIAQAAGVAEGTIFGVFPDKNSLVVTRADPGAGPAADAGRAGRDRPTARPAAAADHRRPSWSTRGSPATRADDRRPACSCSTASPDGRPETDGASRGERCWRRSTAVIEPDADQLRRCPASRRPTAAAVLRRQHVRAVRRPGDVQRRRDRVAAARRTARSGPN